MKRRILPFLHETRACITLADCLMVFGPAATCVAYPSSAMDDVLGRIWQYPAVKVFDCYLDKESTAYIGLAPRQGTVYSIDKQNELMDRLGKALSRDPPGEARPLICWRENAGLEKFAEGLVIKFSHFRFRDGDRNLYLVLYPSQDMARQVEGLQILTNRIPGSLLPAYRRYGYGIGLFK